MIVRTEAQVMGAAICGQLIKEECVSFDRYEVCYKLFGASHVYLIEVALEHEFAFLPAGESLADAVILYDKLVKGIVTPCTAKDVWRDLQMK